MWLLGILAWAVALNIGGWLLNVDLTWQVCGLVASMCVIDKIIDRITRDA